MYGIIWNGFNYEHLTGSDQLYKREHELLFSVEKMTGEIVMTKFKNKGIHIRKGFDLLWTHLGALCGGYS